MTFTAHNIRLDDGSFTYPEARPLADIEPCTSALRTLELAFCGDVRGKSIVDLGCLEGGFTVEFARRGMHAIGIEARKSNFENCELVRMGLSLPNLRFTLDDVRNISNYPEFDAAFCCGILYHLDRPVEFLNAVAAKTKRVLILNTHYALDASCQNFLSFQR